MISLNLPLQPLLNLMDERLRGGAAASHQTRLLESVNAEIGNAMSHARLSRKGADFVWV